MTLIEQYIEEHKVTSSNALIFRDCDAFVHVLYENGGRVDMIVWYEYCRINEQKLGSGGYADPENKGFMWAETQLFGSDLCSRTLDELLDYILQFMAKYPEYELYPEFYLAE